MLEIAATLLRVDVEEADEVDPVLGVLDQLAGDQLYLDFDLSAENLPAGSHLAIGSAVIEVTPPPHLGCGKFVARFGLEAMKFVNSPVGKELRLRGIHARVIQPGQIRTGDRARKVEKT